MLRIIEKTKILFIVSAIIIAIGLGAWIFKGLNFGIDFVGGTVVDMKIGKDFNVEDVRKIAEKYDPQAQVQKVEGDEVLVRSNVLTNDQIPQLFKEVKDKYQLDDNALRSTDTIGPSVGKELRQKAILSSIVAVIGILIYVTIRFEYITGMAAIIALLHDLIITISVYTIFQIPVNSSFIAAILTILGYSINDTIVVFDRIRENKKLGKHRDLTTLANVSITQTIARSINTVLTTLFTITAIYILGVPAIKEFALPLIIGIVSGAYSSIFIASPIWVTWMNKRAKHA